MRLAVTIVAVGIAAILVAGGLRGGTPARAGTVEPPPGLSVETPETLPPDIAARLSKDDEPAQPRPAPQDVKTGPTRERVLEAQRTVAARHADALELDEATRTRFIDDYMLCITPIVDTDAAAAGTENLRKIIDQRMTEFEAAVATYLPAEKVATMRKRMKR